MDEHGDTYPSHNRIPGDSKEARELQMLLDPYYEKSDQPTGFVGISDGTRCEMEIAGQAS